MDLLRVLCAWLCEAIYWLLAGLYDLFINISRVQLLTTEDIQPIYQRITMILTIVMVFYVTFEAVKFVIQPDQFSDKEKGASKILYKMVMVVILIAFVPSIFSWAYKIQNKIFDTQVFSKVILGKNNIDTNQFGKNLAYNVFGMFYRVDDNAFTAKELEEQANCDDIPCKQVVAMNLYQLQAEGNLISLDIGLNAKDKVTDPTTGEKVNKYYIDFNGIFAVGVGGFIVYMLLLYCIDAGVRVAQLLFLQIIAPIPIMGYLSPKKDGMFEKWLKQCITTYLDLFIRVAIIHFILLICNILGDSFSNGTLVNNVGGSPTWLIYVALIMGLLMFAQKAPKMLGELFPSSGAAAGNFGLKAKDRLDPTMNALRGTGRVVGAVGGTVAGAAMGVATGIKHGLRRKDSLDKNGIKKGARAGAWGAAKGAIRGLVGGAIRGGTNGAKKGNMLKNIGTGIKEQSQHNERFGNREEQGYGFRDQMGDRLRGITGSRSRVAEEEAKKAPIKRHDEALKKVTDTEAKIKERALTKIKEGSTGKLKAEADALSAAEAELKALEDPQTAQEKFKAGKYTDADKAQQDYHAALLLAKSSVNRSNFVDASGNFDQAGYDAACAAAMKQVNAQDYTVAFETAAKAQEAYQRKVEEAKNAVNRSSYSTQADYDAAVQAAVNGVNKDLFIQGYATEADAKNALAAAINAARTNKDELEKQAIAAYVKNAGDAAIDQMIEELGTYVDGKEDENGNRTGGYNTTADANRRVTVDYKEIKDNFKMFSDKVKKTDVAGNYRQDINNNASDIIAIDTEIDRIKRQTENSGINDGKKS